MRQKPLKFNTLEEALPRIAGRFQIPLEQCLGGSKLLRDALFQRKITEYFRGQDVF